MTAAGRDWRALREAAAKRAPPELSGKILYLEAVTVSFDGFKALNHLSHGYSSRDELGDWYERLFGMRTIHRSEADGSETGFRTRVLEHEPTRQLRFEMIEPASGASFIQRFLERRGPGMHHVTFEVHDWDRAVSACAHHNIPIFGEQSDSTDGVPWREAFIHPRYTGGVLVQFFWQAEPGAWV